MTLPTSLIDKIFIFKLKIVMKKILLAGGGGWNVDDQNVDRPKISERRNGLFS